MPSAIEVFQGNFEIFKMIELFNLIKFYRIITIFKILKFCLQNIQNYVFLILEMSGCFIKLSKVELMNS